MASVLTVPNVQELRGAVRGEVIEPDHARYDAARSIWNAMIDKRPGLIVQCMGAADVMRSVDFARSHDLLVAVRGGGHNVAGNAVCDGGMVIDLSQLKGVRVDPARRAARANPGVTWGEFDHETQVFALATPGGLVSTTGIAGFTLGGGLGWLSRKHGATCDNLLSADIITAEGRRLTASADENEDLFWAIRGGGGNFGIVTSFEYRLHQVGPEILAGLVFFPLARGPEILRFLRDLIPSAPNELFGGAVVRIAPPAPFLPPEIHGTKVIALAVFYAGNVEEGEEALRPIQELEPWLLNLVAPRAYTQWQGMLDASWPPGFQNYWKSEYLQSLSDSAIDTIVSFAERITSSLSDFKVIPLGGAISALGEDDSALSHRTAPFVLNINSRWADRQDSDRHIEWTTEFWNAMRPYSAGGVFLNFLGDEGHSRVRAAYGAAKYERLAALKAKYDPTNFFRMNQNIRPMAGGVFGED